MLAELPDGWHTCTVRALAPEGIAGGPFGSSLGRKDYAAAGVPVIRGSNLSDSNGFRGDDFAFVSENKANELRRNLAVPGDIVLTQRGTLGQVARVPDGPYARYVISQSQMRVRPAAAIADPAYVFLAMRSPRFVEQIKQQAIATGVPHINLGILDRLTIPLPPLREQRAIAEVLGVFDDKIESNRQVTSIALDLARSMYRPVVTGVAETRVIAQVAEFHNRRRVPLSSGQRAEMPGSVPYYGATGVIDCVDRSLFDEHLVLVGEDGSVVNDDGTPVVQYVWGPCWVNNHAHVLTGVGVSTELLLLMLQEANVRPRVTGAVQAKLSMTNLKAVDVRVPTGDVLASLETEIEPLLAVVRSASTESATLAELRDTLLPELLSGRLRAPVAEETITKAI